MCKPSQLSSKSTVFPVIYRCVTHFPKISGVKPQSFDSALMLCVGIWMRRSRNALSFLTVSSTSAGTPQRLRARRVAGITPLEPEHRFQDAASLPCLVAWLGLAEGGAQLGLSAQVLTCRAPAGQPQGHPASYIGATSREQVCIHCMACMPWPEAIHRDTSILSYWSQQP